MQAKMMVDHPVPEFALPATGNQTFTLSEAQGSTLVLYFYPKDNTPGCTTEAGEFRDLHASFRKAGCAIYGISPSRVSQLLSRARRQLAQAMRLH